MAYVTPAEIRLIGGSAISSVSDTDLESIVDLIAPKVENDLGVTFEEPLDSEYKLAIIYYVLFILYSQPTFLLTSGAGLKAKLGKFEIDNSKSAASKRDPAQFYLDQYNEMIKKILSSTVGAKRATIELDTIFEDIADDVDLIRGSG